MLFDTHCHLDRYPDPLAIATEAEHQGIVVFGMTSLPSHFEMGIEHVRQFRKIRLTLGLHPLLAAKHRRELTRFRELASSTSYIGEVGLDFSSEGTSTRKEQCAVFDQLLDAIADRPRFLSIHSRRAEKEALSALRARGIRLAVLHWYTGSISLALEAVDDGHFFSVNPAMLRSSAGRRLIARLPRERVLTETDGPYVRINGKPAVPSDVPLVIGSLAKAWDVPTVDAERQVEANAQSILSDLASP